jgi:hypothetical protein
MRGVPILGQTGFYYMEKKVWKYFWLENHEDLHIQEEG